MAQRKAAFKRIAPSEKRQADGDRELMIVWIVLFSIFFVLALFLLFTVPTVGILLLVMIIEFALTSMKKNGLTLKDVADKVGWKDSGQKAAKKFISRMKAEEAIEKEFKSHPHTPMAYSYDSCAKEKRLEQIRTLRNAGLLTEAEYKQRRSSILAEK